MIIIGRLWRARQTLRVAAAAWGSLFLGILALASPALAQTAYISITDANSVSVIDTASNTVTATIPVGIHPSGVAVSPNGSRAYVANYTDNTFDGTVSVIDTASNTVIATIPVGIRPTGVAVSPNGSLAYVANNFGGTVSVIDTASNTVTATIPVGGLPHGVAVSPNGLRAYVADESIFAVKVIDTTSNTVTDTISVGGRSFALGQFIGPTPTPPAPVPTMSEWAMILLGLAFAGVAAVLIQRQRAIA